MRGEEILFISFLVILGIAGVIEFIRNWQWYVDIMRNLLGFNDPKNKNYYEEEEPDENERD